ncbi:hypothetical protein NBRC116493_34050 [Aurantivibrio infirmus]
MKTSLVLKVFAVILVVAGAGYYFFPATNPEGKLEYTTAEVSRGDIQNLVVTSGTVKAVGTVEIGSQISGQISELYVDFNSEVKKGDLLAQIDPRTYEGRVKQSEASLEIAKANVMQQDASLMRARADLGEAERLLERQKKLGQAGHISESEIDRLTTALESARAQVTISQAQVSNAKASVIQAEASLFQANIDLERCTIRSPVDGIVINRAIELGQTVAASMSAPILFTLAQDLSEMQVEASVDEADIGKIKMDQVATFTVDAFPDKKIEGKIKQVRKAANEVSNVVTYTVIISAENRDNSLLPGMTATVSVITGKKTNVLRVPNTALRFQPPGIERDDSNPRAAFMETRIQEMKQQLSLSAEQEKAIRKVFEDQMAQFSGANRRAPGGFGPPGGRRDGPSGGNGGGMFNNEEIQKILSEQQYQEFRRIAREGGSSRRQMGGERPKPGQLWLLLGKNELEKRPVLTGLAGDEFTEIVNADGLEGSTVVLRARRINE